MSQIASCSTHSSRESLSTFSKKWQREEVLALFSLPFGDLIAQAHTIHAQFFNPNQVQLSTLLNIKTGSCPENCSYCSQSAHYKTGLKKEPLMSKEDVVALAQRAKQAGATRFCMGAAWRGPRDADLEQVIDMIRDIKALGLETCVTLGMLKEHQAEKLKEAGLDYYNHNLDTSEAFYEQITTSHTFQDRLETLGYVQAAGIEVCCGGILGMGESRDDRADLLVTIANMSPQPKSVPINLLVKIPGTPLADRPPLDSFEFVRTIACARIMFPHSYVRLSAGRTNMSDELQALCFFAGANSIFHGEILLTTENPLPEKDQLLFERLGLEALPALPAYPPP